MTFFCPESRKYFRRPAFLCKTGTVAGKRAGGPVKGTPLPRSPHQTGFCVSIAGNKWFDVRSLRQTIFSCFSFYGGKYIGEEYLFGKKNRLNGTAKEKLSEEKRLFWGKTTKNLKKVGSCAIIIKLHILILRRRACYVKKRRNLHFLCSGKNV